MGELLNFHRNVKKDMKGYVDYTTKKAVKKYKKPRSRSPKDRSPKRSDNRWPSSKEMMAGTDGRSVLSPASPNGKGRGEGHNHSPLLKPSTGGARKDYDVDELRREAKRNIQARQKFSVPTSAEISAGLVQSSVQNVLLEHHHQSYNPHSTMGASGAMGKSHHSTSAPVGRFNRSDTTVSGEDSGQDKNGARMNRSNTTTDGLKVSGATGLHDSYNSCYRSASDLTTAGLDVSTATGGFNVSAATGGFNQSSASGGSQQEVGKSSLNQDMLSSMIPSNMSTMRTDPAVHADASTLDGWTDNMTLALMNEGPKRTARKNVKTTPGPGTYVWKHECHKDKPAEWSINAPTRANLDYKVQSWVPTSTSAVGAPDPGTYGDLGRFHESCGAIEIKSTKFGNSKSVRKTPMCYSNDLLYKLPPVTGIWKHPTNVAPPGWSVASMNRNKLGYADCTWLPQISTNVTPGPGSYKIDSIMVKRDFHNARKSSTFGGKPRNLPQGVSSWVSETYSQRNKYY